MSVPDVLSVAEYEETVQVCATLNTPFSFEFDITVMLTTQDVTGIIIMNNNFTSLPPSQLLLQYNSNSKLITSGYSNKSPYPRSVSVHIDCCVT